LALVVLQTNLWPVVKANLQRVIDALASIQAGAYIPVSFDIPPLRRRPFTPGGAPPS
jgi:hypothetical protein